MAALTTQAAQARSPARCGPNDRQEPALQGQVPVSVRLNGAAEPGYWCNLELVGEFASRSFANFDTYKHCAYYTDNRTFASDDGNNGGVVLDVSDPRHPVKTAYLRARAMGNGGETLRVNQARGLLVSAHYSALGEVAADGLDRALAVYDVSADCAHPRLLADVLLPSAVGHEGCFQPDGMVYYVASSFSITPVDLSDPTKPRQLSDPWPLIVHGCSISDDGKRGYFASVYTGSMLIVDTSQVQARIPGAEPRLISRFRTLDAPIQQATVPLTYNGRAYVLQWSEGTFPSKLCVPGQANFGYPRIIDVADETRPREVSKIQTEVVKPGNCLRIASDVTVQTRAVDRGDYGYPLASYIFVYDSHMCTPDRLHDPTIVACSQLGSGLRVYDIRDPRQPREIAYYNTGTANRSDPTLDWAFARPVIRRDLGQIWWVTNLEGFHVAQFRKGVWPFEGDDACPPGYDYFQDQYDLGYRACQARRTAPRCTERRVFDVRLPRVTRARVSRVEVFIDGKSIRTLRGRRSRVRVDLRGYRPGLHTVRVVVRARTGGSFRLTRRYRLCPRERNISTAGSGGRASTPIRAPLLPVEPRDPIGVARRAAVQSLLLCHLIPTPPSR